ncbi:MAG: hypothetical protein ACOYXC_08870, partial [Candidatus Rifleibacteriota bacterium]
MKTSFFKLFVIGLMLLAVGPTRLPAAQEIKETMILSGYLGEIFAFNRQIYKYSHLMQDQARPFGNP